MTETTAERIGAERTCGYPDCERPSATPVDDVSMCAEHRALWDADAELEAWRFAQSIMRPWVESTKAIGSDELTYIMETALVECEARIELARGALMKGERAL